MGQLRSRDPVSRLIGQIEFMLVATCYHVFDVTRMKDYYLSTIQPYTKLVIYMRLLK